MVKYIEQAMSITTFKIKHKLAPTVTDIPTKKFQNLEIDFRFHEKLGVIISKQRD